jgi:hypothetical protein
MTGPYEIRDMAGDLLDPSIEQIEAMLAPVLDTVDPASRDEVRRDLQDVVMFATPGWGDLPRASEEDVAFYAAKTYPKWADRIGFVLATPEEIKADTAPGASYKECQDFISRLDHPPGLQ